MSNKFTVTKRQIQRRTKKKFDHFKNFTLSSTILNDSIVHFPDSCEQLRQDHVQITSPHVQSNSTSRSLTQKRLIMDDASTSSDSDSDDEPLKQTSLSTASLRPIELPQQLMSPSHTQPKRQRMDATYVHSPSQVSECATPTSISNTDLSHNDCASGSITVSIIRHRHLSQKDNEYILQKILKIEQILEQNALMLGELIRTNRKVCADNLIEPENIPDFPLRSLEQFNNFDNLLVSDDAKTLRQYMVRRLAALGGSGLPSLTRRILKFLISNEVAILFNWKGREKLSFQNTNTMKMLYESANFTFPSEEKNDLTVANTVKNWLKFAKVRMQQEEKKTS